MAACGCGLVRLLAVKKRVRPQRLCLHQTEQDHRAVAGAGPQSCGRCRTTGPQSCGRSRTTELWQEQDHRALAGLAALTWERPVSSYVENASAYKQRTVKKLVVISQARSGSVVEEDLEK